MFKALVLLNVLKSNSAQGHDLTLHDRSGLMMTLLSEAMQMSNSIHDAESFLEYGCWCASNPSSNGYDLTKGKSAPVDNIDGLCRSTAQCHMCLELDDFEEECDFYQSYNYTFLNNSMTCEDEEGSCAWASCQCDAEFINGIAVLEAEWNPKHHIRGGFDFDRRCLTPRGLTQPYDQCCGTEYPNRFPYKSNNGQKACCGTKIYDSTFLQCCEMENAMNETESEVTLASNDCQVLADSKGYSVLSEF